MSNLSLQPSSSASSSSFLPDVSPEVKFVGQDGTTVLIEANTPWPLLVDFFLQGASLQGKNFPPNLLFAVYPSDQDFVQNPQPVPLTLQMWENENVPGVVSVVINTQEVEQLGQAEFERQPLPPPPQPQFVPVRPLSPQNFTAPAQSLQQQMNAQHQLFQRLQQQYRDSLPQPVFSLKSHPKLNFQRRTEPIQLPPKIFLPADAPLETYRGKVEDLGWMNPSLFDQNFRRQVTTPIIQDARSTALGPIIRSDPTIAYLKDLQTTATVILTRSSIYSRLLDPFDFIAFPAILASLQDNLPPLEATFDVEILAPEQKETLREMEQRIYGPLDTFAIAKLAKDKVYLQKYLRNAVTFGNYLNINGAPEINDRTAIRLLLATRSLTSFRPYLVDPEDIRQWCRAVSFLRSYVDKQKLELINTQYLAYLDKLISPSDLQAEGEGKEEKKGEGKSAYRNLQCFDRNNPLQQFEAIRLQQLPQDAPSSFLRFQFQRPQAQLPIMPQPQAQLPIMPQPQAQLPIMPQVPVRRVQEPVWILPDFAQPSLPAQAQQAVSGSNILYDPSLFDN